MTDSTPPNSQWDLGKRSTVYSSWWVELHLQEVRQPDGRTYQHEVISVPRDGGGVIVIDDDARALLIWRHRFITEQWGWEIPAGAFEEGEDPAVGAARECLEETGWEPDSVRPLTAYFPSSGMSDQRLHIFLATSATERGAPVDRTEADAVAWRTKAEIEDDLAAGNIPDGHAQMALVLGYATIGSPLRWP